MHIVYMSYSVYCWDAKSFRFITDHKFFSLIKPTAHPTLNSPRIWRLGTKWLFGNHPTAMWAYLDAWRLKPEPNLEWLVFWLGPFNWTIRCPHHIDMLRRDIICKKNSNFSLFTPWNPTYILKNRLDGPILYVFRDEYKCVFFSYFWRQSSLGKRFQQKLRNTTIAISSSAQSYCWFISAKKQFRWRYAPVEIGRLARCK